MGGGGALAALGCVSPHQGDEDGQQESGRGRGENVRADGRETQRVMLQESNSVRETTNATR